MIVSVPSQQTREQIGVCTGLPAAVLDSVGKVPNERGKTLRALLLHMLLQPWCTRQNTAQVSVGDFVTRLDHDYAFTTPALTPLRVFPTLQVQI